jgi:hypothetical protein
MRRYKRNVLVFRRILKILELDVWQFSSQAWQTDILLNWREKVKTWKSPKICILQFLTFSISWFVQITFLHFVELKLKHRWSKNKRRRKVIRVQQAFFRKKGKVNFSIIILSKFGCTSFRIQFERKTCSFQWNR